MKNFHFKSIIIGIGMGAIITSIISMIFFAGYNPNNSKLSDKEIIERAKILGMVDAKTLLIGDPSGDTKLIGENTVEAPTPVVTLVPSVSPVPEKTPTPAVKTETEEVIVVQRGDSSELVAQKLVNANLIQNKKQFIEEITRLGLAMEINIGQYKIKKGTEVRQIIKILTTIK